MVAHRNGECMLIALLTDFDGSDGLGLVKGVICCMLLQQLKLRAMQSVSSIQLSVAAIRTS